MFLTPADLQTLTGKEKPSAQARELEYMKIPFRIRRDGSLAVLKIHVETIEGCENAQQQTRPRVRFGS